MDPHYQNSVLPEGIDDLVNPRADTLLGVGQRRRHPQLYHQGGGQAGQLEVGAVHRGSLGGQYEGHQVGQRKVEVHQISQQKRGGQY